MKGFRIEGEQLDAGQTETMAHPVSVATLDTSKVTTLTTSSGVYHGGDTMGAGCTDTRHGTIHHITLYNTEKGGSNSCCTKAKPPSTPPPPTDKSDIKHPCTLSELLWPQAASISGGGKAPHCGKSKPRKGPEMTIPKGRGTSIVATCLVDIWAPKVYTTLLLGPLGNQSYFKFLRSRVIRSLQESGGGLKFRSFRVLGSCPKPKTLGLRYLRVLRSRASVFQGFEV